MISIRSRHSRRAPAIQRSAMAFARGAMTGLLIIRTPIALNTASKRLSELGVAVPDQELKAGSMTLQVHEQVAGLLGDPVPARRS
jgi:hypothetical protein